VEDTWLGRTVRLPDGGTHLMLVDRVQTDAVTEMYLAGDGIWVNSYLVATMFALTERGDRVLDLGGFVGEFALAAAAHGCEVVSVEANANQASMLATSAELNRFDDLRVVQAAVGEVPGTVTFHLRGPYGQVTRGAEPVDGASYADVLQVTVDDLVAALGWDRVDFVKIDVEGSEAAALKGAARLLSAPDAPALVIENNTFVLRDLSPDPNALLRQVEAFGYTLFALPPEGIWAWNSEMFQPEVVYDYLALKGRTPADVGLEVQPPRSLDQQAAIIAKEIGKSFDHRIAVAWALRFAPADLRAHRVVADVVAELQVDPDERIRAEAARIGEAARTTAAPLAEATGPSAGSTDLDGAWAAERALRRSAESRLAIAADLRAPADADGPGPDGLESGDPNVLRPATVPGPTAIALAVRLTEFARRHRAMTAIARRVIQRRS